MQIIDIVSEGYKKHFGVKNLDIYALPQSGSDRKYFRLNDGSRKVIGAYNANPEENDAFIGFTRHFLTQGLPVPEIYATLPITIEHPEVVSKSYPDFWKELLRFNYI